MDPFKAVEEFHAVFDPNADHKTRSLTQNEALKRAHFMQEELVEYLAGSCDSEEEFDKLCQQLKESIDIANAKVKDKGNIKAGIVEQSDALVDLIYFCYGTFVKMNVDPRPLIEIVHQANMGKLFPDGKPHYDEVTHKVLKPDNWQEDFAPEKRLAEEIQKQKESNHD